MAAEQSSPHGVPGDTGIDAPQTTDASTGTRRPRAQVSGASARGSSPRAQAVRRPVPTSPGGDAQARRVGRRTIAQPPSGAGEMTMGEISTILRQITAQAAVDSDWFSQITDDVQEVYEYVNAQALRTTGVRAEVLQGKEDLITLTRQVQENDHAGRRIFGQNFQCAYNLLVIRKTTSTA